MPVLEQQTLFSPKTAKMAGVPPIAAVSVVVPVYNSEGTLAELVTRLNAVLSRSVREFEIILVNDGSRDQSWQVISQLAVECPNVGGLNLMRNYGQHNALLAGICQAQYEAIVTIDDDLQNPPEEIPKLLAALDEGADVVYGTPDHEQHGFWRDMTSQVTKLALQNAMGVETARGVSAFRAFRSQIREAFAGYLSPSVCIDVLLTWGTTRFTTVPVHHEPRRVGQSNYTFRKLVIHTINMTTGFSTWPLQLASLMGFGFTLFGLVVLIVVVGRYLAQGRSVPGFAFLASIIAIFSGAQLFGLGIMGEYLARMFSRSMGRPYCVIRSKIGFE